MGGVFINLGIEFQRFSMNIKTLIARILGVLATIIYSMDGTSKLVYSIWKGPPGQMVEFICFEPNTLLRLENGTVKKIKNINITDKLKNNTSIIAKMKINNINAQKEYRSDLYRLNGGENNKPIYVSGEHLVYNPISKTFVPVKNIKSSIKSTKKSSVLYCLITSNNTIPIGNWLFHDWEDNNGSPSKNIV